MRESDWLNYLNSFVFHKTDKDMKKALYTALFKSIKDKNYEAITTLIQKGANVNYVYEDGNFALKEAIITQDMEMLIFLHKFGASFSIADKEYKNATYFAIDTFNSNVLQYMFDKGVYSHFRIKKTHHTPLIIATLKSNLQAVQLLLSKSRSNVNEVDAEKNNALYYNMSKLDQSNDDREIGILLLNAGGDLDSENANGETPRMATETSIEKQSMIENHEITKEIEQVTQNKSKPSGPKRKL